MGERPKLKIKLTAIDKTFEILGWASMLAIWVLTIANYTNMPHSIPIHYSGTGQADAFGGKENIFMLPLIASALFIGLTSLSKFPHIFNYPTKINEANAVLQYTNAARLIRYLKFIIVIIFGLIALQTIRNVNGQTSGLGVLFLPWALGLFLIPLTYCIIKLYRTTTPNKTNNPSLMCEDKK